jgi:hypothetical protein
VIERACQSVVRPGPGPTSETSSPKSTPLSDQGRTCSRASASTGSIGSTIGVIDSSDFTRSDYDWLEWSCPYPESTRRNRVPDRFRASKDNRRQALVGHASHLPAWDVIRPPNTLSHFGNWELIESMPHVGAGIAVLQGRAKSNPEPFRKPLRADRVGIPSPQAANWKRWHPLRPE